MKRYLLTKLAEEASEVAQAACKMLLHRDKAARAQLLTELADMEAMTTFVRRGLTAKQRSELNRMVLARIQREESKGKV